MNSEQVAFFLLSLAPCDAAALLTTAAVKQQLYLEVMQILDALVLADASDPARAAASVRAAEYRLVRSGALLPEVLRAWRIGRRALRPRQLLRAGEELLRGIEVRQPMRGGPPPVLKESLLVTEGPALMPGHLPARPQAAELDLFVASLPSGELRAKLSIADVSAAQGVNCVLILTSGLAELIWYGGLTWEGALILLKPHGILPEEETVRVLSHLRRRSRKEQVICSN